MSGDIGGLARYAYSQGKSPLDWAEFIVRTDIEWHLIISAGRHENPESFPGFPPDLTLDALSRRIIGSLLDAGWTMPDGKP